MTTKNVFFAQWTALLLFIGWACTPLSAVSQRYLADAIPYRTRAVVSAPDGGLVEVEYTRRTHFVMAHPEAMYFSFYRDSIYRTQGGYHGHALHGRYVERHPGHSLKTLGTYCYGLKDGLWQYWDVHGTLRKREQWRQGVLTGPFAIYGSDGKLHQAGSMRKGVYHGIVASVATRDSTIWDKKRYRHGEVRDWGAGSWLGRAYDNIRYRLLSWTW